MRLKVDGHAAVLARRGTIVSIRTDKQVWMVNTPDAPAIVDALNDASVAAKDLEARGFTAMKS